MIGLEPARQGRRSLARLYDWILFTIAVILIQVETEYMALSIARKTHEWVSIERDIASLVGNFGMPSLPILVTSEPFVQFWAKMMFIVPMVMVFLYELPLVALCGPT